MMPVMKRIRRDARVTQRKVAEVLGKQELTVKRWEKGQSEPPFSLVCRLVKKYELNILRYMFSFEDYEELCNRGYGDYALKLEQGHYIPHDVLIALHDRDWQAVDKYRAKSLSVKIADEIWEQITDHVAWGDTPRQAAIAAYAHHEQERWEGLAEELAIDILTIKFQKVIQITYL